MCARRARVETSCATIQNKIQLVLKECETCPANTQEYQRNFRSKPAAYMRKHLRDKEHTRLRIDRVKLVIISKTEALNQ